MKRRRTSILLLGPRGSGKTTVGRLLSCQLKLPLVDLDQELVNRAGLTIAEIFDRWGQPWFRRLESQVLRDTLRRSRTRPMIISTGGGVVVRQVNRQRLGRFNSPRVYLSCDPVELDRRVRQDAATRVSRPSLTDLQGVSEILALLTMREPWYKQLATHQIDVTTKSAEEVAREVLNAIWPKNKKE